MDPGIVDNVLTSWIVKRFDKSIDCALTEHSWKRGLNLPLSSIQFRIMYVLMEISFSDT